ncbi:Xaa-Pro aminopeptidase [Thermoflexales bacterium]|nr:Xaa-Pro aminopeptidase [Thermoflexales bacterium]
MTHIQHRLTEVRRLLEEKNLPALLVMQAENRRYLSGFTGSAGMLLITPTQAILSTDFRYWEQGAKQAPGFTLHQAAGGYKDFLPGLIAAGGKPARVGIESFTVTLAQYEQMQKVVPDVEWVGVNGLIENVRAVKDADELALTQKTIDLAEEGLRYLLTLLKPGMTEKQAAWDLEVYLRSHGADALSFDTIVAAGPNAALPHHHPSERVIQANEPITIDWGAAIDGYRSDLTRTIVLGEPDAKFREIYGIVLKAQLNAIGQIKAGQTGREADAFARDVIVAAGYGDYFGHGLGHGVGLAVHEQPRASFTVEDERLPTNSLLTVEPGIYLPGWGGVRIEDMVLVQEQGVEVLSHFEK